MKPTQVSLAKYIGYTKQGISKMKRESPNKFNLLWKGWIIETKLDELNKDKDNLVSQHIYMLVTQWLKENK